MFYFCLRSNITYIIYIIQLLKIILDIRIILLYIVLSLFDIFIYTCESKSLESVKVNNNVKQGVNNDDVKR